MRFELKESFKKRRVVCCKLIYGSFKKEENRIVNNPRGALRIVMRLGKESAGRKKMLKMGIVWLAFLQFVS